MEAYLSRPKMEEVMRTADTGKHLTKIFCNFDHLLGRVICDPDYEVSGWGSGRDWCLCDEQR